MTQTRKAQLASLARGSARVARVSYALIKMDMINLRRTLHALRIMILNLTVWIMWINLIFAGRGKILKARALLTQAQLSRKHARKINRKA